MIIKALALMSVVGKKDKEEAPVESPMWYAKQAKLHRIRSKKKKK